MNLTERTLGGQFCKFIDAASTNNKFYALVVNADCVLTVLTSVGGVNLLTQYNLSGKTLKQGTYIPMFKGDLIANVTPSSGSVIGYGDITD